MHGSIPNQAESSQIHDMTWQLVEQLQLGLLKWHLTLLGSIVGATSRTLWVRDSLSKEALEILNQASY